MESYIKKKEKATGKETCSLCKEIIADGNQILVETRVSWFRGEDEMDWYHGKCKSVIDIQFQKEQAKAQERSWKKQKAWIESTKPKWDKLEKMLQDNQIEVKKFPMTGQWNFNNKIDWWTTTGTAMNRKTREKFTFSVNKPEFIIYKILFDNEKV